MSRQAALKEQAEDGESEVTVELGPLDSQRGVLMTLLDSAMVQAAASRIGFERDAVTVDLHVAFVHPDVVRPAFVHPANGRLTVRARACGGGKSVCFCEAEASDAGGQVVARAMGTLRYRKA